VPISFLQNTELIQKTASQLVGNVELSVPKYSAVKVDGEALHKKARRGDQFEAPKRYMRFDDVEFLGIIEPDLLKFSIKCGKGAFIRSWVHQFGEILGYGATVTSLRRTLSEPYSVENAITLENLESWLAIHPQASLTKEPWKIDLTAALSSWPKYQVAGFHEALMRNGQLPNELKAKILSNSSELEKNRPLGICIEFASTQKLAALLSLSAENDLTIRKVYPENSAPN
jgi:tRNA pseudouridine55 synthase